MNLFPQSTGYYNRALTNFTVVLCVNNSFVVYGLLLLGLAAHHSLGIMFIFWFDLLTTLANSSVLSLVSIIGWLIIMISGHGFPPVL